MANGNITEDPSGMDPGMDPSGGGGGAPGAPPPGGAPPMAGPPGGSPIMAALQRASVGPQISSPGPGNQADAMNKISMAIQMIQQSIASLPMGSPLHKDALSAVQRLSRHLGQGFQGPAAGVQRTGIQDMLHDTIRNFIAARMGGGQGGQPGGGPGAAPGGMPPGAPSPSTPLPGA